MKGCVPFLFLSGDFPLRRLLFLESGGLRQYPPREVIEHDSGLDQPERFPVRRGSIQHHSVLGISPSGQRRGRFDLDA